MRCTLKLKIFKNYSTYVSPFFIFWKKKRREVSWMVTWGSHRGDDEEWYLLVCHTIPTGKLLPIFFRFHEIPYHFSHKILMWLSFISVTWPNLWSIVLVLQFHSPVSCHGAPSFTLNLFILNIEHSCEKWNWSLETAHTLRFPHALLNIWTLSNLAVIKRRFYIKTAPIQCLVSREYLSLNLH